MTPRITTLLALCGLLCGLLLAPLLTFSAQAADSEPTARIGGLGVKVEGGQLLVHFRLVGGFDEDLKKRIDSGMPTSLVFEIELARARRSWFDKAVASGELRVIATYNALTREYLVNFKHDGNLIDSKVVRDAAELRKVMTEITALPAFVVQGRPKDERLFLRVRAELGTGTIFFFIPRTLRTNWAETGTFRLRDL